MYHYVEDKVFLRKMRNECGDIMQDLCHELKENFDIGAQAFLVGSGKRKLILQNENEPVDLDYNLEVTRCDHFNNCRQLKEDVRKAFNRVLHKYEWNDCQDSTSSLTTERRYFKEGNNTEFSIDVCIVARNDEGNFLRLIHTKTGNIFYDNYNWNEAPNSCKIRKKAEFIKEKSQWNKVREEYLRIKNMYLHRNDHNHPSFICYIEAVNNVYHSIKNQSSKNSKRR